MRRLLFAANWKMNLGPVEARDYCARFRARIAEAPERDTWFFPPAVSLEAVATSFAGLRNTRVGAQDVHWEPQGAFTGATSVALAKAAGATAVLIGHSERRHLFGDSDEATNKKLKAALTGGLLPVLCVGETLEQRQRGETNSVVLRQLHGAIQGLIAADLLPVVYAYEPVWAIGTGHNATPSDAAAVHRELRSRLRTIGLGRPRILYGGSVNATNAAALLAEPEIEGVLVGGASLDPEGWAGICSVG